MTLHLGALKVSWHSFLGLPAAYCSYLLLMYLQTALYRRQTFAPLCAHGQADR